MLDKVKIYSYNQESEGAKNLAEALGIKRLKHQGSRWNPRNGTVINWGSSRLPEFPGIREIINPADEVSFVSDKLKFFQKATIEDAVDFLPEWTDEKDIASLWLEDGHTVVSRTVLNGHSGNGIVLTTGADRELPDAPLYTKYFKKLSEFRVHVAFGEVIDVQQKKRKTDVPDDEVNWKIRNLAGGFIYARENVTPPEKVTQAALEVSKAFGLHFGAWDVLYNRTEDKAVVLECNTAPGLTGTTVEKYSAAFKKYFEERN